MLANFQAFKIRLLGVLVDWYYGVDTRGVISPKLLEIDPEHCHSYAPVAWSDLKRVLRVLEIGREEVFLDLGCGKGRALLAAAAFDFQRVVGVEISQRLCEIARANIKRFTRGNAASAAKFEIVEADAAL